MKMVTLLLPFLLRPTAWWVEWHERKILRDGVPLSAEGLLDASMMGVAHPEKIRLMKVDQIPVLNGRLVKTLSAVFPMIACNTVGLTLRYGIYIRSRYWEDRHLIAHECVHTGQFERSGSIRAFLNSYFTQCLEVGYPDAPMEQEAIVRSSILP